jgi:hypothetical protein
MKSAILAMIALSCCVASSWADPRIDYMLNCRGCHGPEGDGLPGGAPSFRGQIARFLSVPGGREYLIRVPGTAQSELSDARVALLLDWIVREFDGGDVPENYTPYTEGEVATHRARSLTDVESERRAQRRANEASDRQEPTANP